MTTTYMAKRKRSHPGFIAMVHSFWKTVKIISRNNLTACGAVILLTVCVLAILAPILAPNPNAVDTRSQFAPPSSAHWLGTDQFGRDLLSRVLAGARVSLFVGVAATGLAGVLGVLIGAVAGWVGGRVDAILMRVMDVILAFPYLILAIAVAAVVGPGLGNIIWILGLVRTPHFARIARSAVLSVRERQFVLAAHSIGVHPWTILFRHVLPQCATPIVVYASSSFASAINAEASLSFLGLGIMAPTSSWGTMISGARLYMLVAPWLAIVPGLAVTLTVLGANLLGDGLRDASDPRSRGGKQA